MTPDETCTGFDSFFFFQAEDGIRDVAVTGVQTCALPISSAPFRAALSCEVEPRLAAIPECGRAGFRYWLEHTLGQLLYAREGGRESQIEEIGRASCRERV